MSGTTITQADADQEYNALQTQIQNVTQANTSWYTPGTTLTASIPIFQQLSTIAGEEITYATELQQAGVPGFVNNAGANAGDAGSVEPLAIFEQAVENATSEFASTEIPSIIASNGETVNFPGDQIESIILTYINDLQIGDPKVTIPPPTATLVLTAPTLETVNAGLSAVIAGVSVSEAGSTSNETFTVTLADIHGNLSATGAGVTGLGTSRLTVSGSLAAVNADLATLSDTDATKPSDTITLSASDSLGNHATAATIAVTVKSPPPPTTVKLTPHNLQVAQMTFISTAGGQLLKYLAANGSTTPIQAVAEAGVTITKAVSGGLGVLDAVAGGLQVGTDINQLINEFDTGGNTQALLPKIVTDIGKLGDTLLAAAKIPLPGLGVAIAQSVAGVGLIAAAVVGGAANNVAGAIGSYDAFIKAGDSPSQALSATLHSNF